MTVLMICHTARTSDGFWYLSTIAFHAALSAWGLTEIGFASFVINLKQSSLNLDNSNPDVE
jgi:hypothetical protein